jgi:hypothetical protein
MSGMTTWDTEAPVKIMMKSLATVSLAADLAPVATDAQA